MGEFKKVLKRWSRKNEKKDNKNLNTPPLLGWTGHVLTYFCWNIPNDQGMYWPSSKQGECD